MGQWYETNKTGEIYHFLVTILVVYILRIITKEKLPKRNSDIIKILGIKMGGKN